MPKDAEEVRARLKARAPARLKAAGAKAASVALVLVPDAADGLEILFIKRSEHPSDPWSGQMALPGGRRERGDLDLCATALRETFEETGIRLGKELLLGELDDLRPRNPALPPVLIRPFVFGLPRRPGVLPSPEVAGHVWASLRELKAGACREMVAVRGKDIEVDAFRVGPHVVWGITHRILLRFLELL